MIKFSSFVTEASTSDLLPQTVIVAIKASGGKIFQIGGAVRDEILGTVSKDLDILVVGLEMSKLAEVLDDFGKTNMVGKSFGIIKFVPNGETEEIDISVPRVDEKSTGQGHKDFVVKLGGDITLQQDQLRRDFWMNAIAKDIDTGKLWDMDGKGLTDIQKKQVRMISPTAFEDDPLRMLRAVQFASRFGFTIEPETLKEIQKNAKTINSVSADRFQEEFRKMYDKSEKPSIGANLLYKTHLMKQIFPKCTGVPKIIDDIPKGNFPTFLAILLHGAYGNTTKKILQQKMRLSNKDADAVQDVVNWRSTPLRGTNDKHKVVEFASKLSPDGQKSIDAFQTALGGRTLTQVMSRFSVKSLKDLAINGRDLLPLKIKGKMIGTTLQYALKIALNTGRNEKKHLLRAIKKHILSEGRYLLGEELKVESILKYKVNPIELRKLVQLQKKISDSDMIPLKMTDLHITLINTPQYKQMKTQLKSQDLPDPDFKVDFEDPQRIEGNGRVSYYAKVKQQREFKRYVKSIVGHVEDHRIYHVSLANLTGNLGDSVAYV